MEKNPKNEGNKNKAIKHWESKMESKFDVNINADNNLEVEEFEEEKEEVIECTICEDMYLVEDNSKNFIKGKVICDKCLDEIVTIYTLKSLDNDRIIEYLNKEE